MTAKTHGTLISVRQPQPLSQRQRNGSAWKGRHSSHRLHTHLVFVTLYRHRVFTDAHLTALAEILAGVCEDLEAELVEFNGEPDHVHLLVQYRPRTALSDLTNRLKGASSRHMRQQFPELRRHYSRARKLWSSSYFAGSVGGATLERVRAYIENQDRPA